MVRKSSTKTKIFWFQKIQTKTKPHWNRTEKLNLVQPVLASFFGSSVFCTPLAASYSLLEFMQSRILWDEMCDTLCWCLKEDGKFDTQSFNHAIRGVRILCFLGRVFGNQRFLSEWLSFCGQLLMVGFLLWIISYLGVALRQISVVCVVVMGSRWTTFFFIVMLHIPYGLLCFRLLVFIGLCQDRWQDFYFFGINGLGIILQIFGIWFQVVWCGLYG